MSGSDNSPTWEGRGPPRHIKRGTPCPPSWQNKKNILLPHCSFYLGPRQVKKCYPLERQKTAVSTTDREGHKNTKKVKSDSWKRICRGLCIRRHPINGSSFYYHRFCCYRSVRAQGRQTDREKDTCVARWSPWQQLPPPRKHAYCAS